MTNYDTLHALLEKATGSLAVEMHSSPDPDALAAGLVLYELAQAHGLQTSLTYNGEISHPQNIVMIKKLNIPLTQYAVTDEPDYDHFIYVDHSGTNSVWGRSKKITIDRLLAVVDHHDVDVKVGAQFEDKRAVGSSSSMVAEYLQQGGMEFFDDEKKKRLATALMLGIRSDTKQLIRNAGDLDHHMHHYLSEYADKSLLQQLENIEWPKNWMDMYARAINNRHQVDGTTIASVGIILPDEHNIIPMVADQLIIEKGVHTVYVLGIQPETINVSIRTTDATYHYGKIMERFPEKISGGGKEGAGGMRLPNPFYHSFIDQDDHKPKIEEIIMAEFQSRIK